MSEKRNDFDSAKNMSRGARRAFKAFMVVAVAAAGLSVGVAVPASAQGNELRPLLDRLERLERDIRTLNIQVSRGGGGSAGSGAVTALPSEPALARLEVRLTALEEELRSVTGRLESESHQIAQINQRLDKLVSDIDYRLSALEKSAASGGGAKGVPAQPVMGKAPPAVPVDQAPPMAGGSGNLGTLKQTDLDATGSARGAAKPAPAGKQTAAAPGALPAGSAKDQYAYAFSLLRQAKYQEAETALKSFIAKHENHALAGNARYWLGETYYVRAQYGEAAKIFYKAYQTDKKGIKAPDALLKLGMSLSGLKKKVQACAAFGKLSADFPSLTPGLQKKLASERQRAGCS
ncbi:MAG: tol-pal system protein YbgF [Rhodospirillales bacterium]